MPTKPKLCGAQHADDSISIANECRRRSVVPVRDLGIFIDADLVMRTHVQKTVSRCFDNYANPSPRTDRNLADTRGRFGIVTTGLRECRVGRPAYPIRRLQSVVNASARMIHRLRSSDHITDALVNLIGFACQSAFSSRSQSSCIKCFMDSRHSI